MFLVLRIKAWHLAVAAALMLALPLTFEIGRRQVTSAPRRMPINSVMTDERKVALTFDDAPWDPEAIPRILAVLQAHGVRSTFFLTTPWVKRYPEMARMIARGGHEIGLHSTSHRDMRRLSREDIIAELEANRRAIEEVTGQRARLFRAPFGAYDDRLLSIAEDELGLVAIQWNVDSRDWRGLSARAIVRRVTRAVRPGSIVLFHSTARHTAEALPEIIAFLRERGYAMVPVSELLHKGDYYVDPMGRQVDLPDGSERPSAD